MSTRDPNRREFLSALGGTLIAGTSMAARPVAVTTTGTASAPLVFDTLIRGGTLHDPGRGIAGPMDIGITGGRISEVAATASDTARRTIDARGLVVTPGLVDIHVHVYPGVPTLGIDPDIVGVSRGVTTLVDAGSSGATNFAGFRDHVIRHATFQFNAG